MKNILVPTDFSVQSLQLVHEIVRKHPQQQVSIHLVHMIHIPGDATDLLFTKKHHLYAQVPYKFSQAIEMLKNKYASRIAWMGLEFYYGSTASVLSDIIESRKIQEVFVFADHAYGTPLQGSVNMINLLSKCKATINRIQPKVKTGMPDEANLFSSLFMEEQPVLQTKRFLQQA